MYQNYLFRVIEFSCKFIIVLSFNRPNVTFKDWNWNFFVFNTNLFLWGGKGQPPLKPHLLNWPSSPYGHGVDYAAY